MERTKVFFGQPLPPLSISGGPEIASQAADQTFAAIVDSKKSALAGAPVLLFLMRAIGTPRFGLVEFVNAFVNETKVGIDFVDFG
jgi:hypothetical protein